MAPPFTLDDATIVDVEYSTIVNKCKIMFIFIDNGINVVSKLMI
jgi:hypothetical protein